MNNMMLIDSLITIDDNGIPKPPSTRQLIDKEVRALYTRDKTPDKREYISDCIVIYYLGDPKSPANQSGLNVKEALVMAIEQAGLPKDYIPDELVRHLIERYHNQCITEAGRVVENLLKAIHNINLSVDVINNLLNEKLSGHITLEEVPTVLQLVDNVNKTAGAVPTIVKKLEEAKQNLMYEKETETARGGGIVLSSMDAEDY